MKLAKVRKIGIGLGTATALTIATAFAAQAGCVFNGSGKVIGVFGGDTKSEFDLNGRKGARMSRGGFSVGRSDSRGLMVFGSRRNMERIFGSLSQAWSVGCLKRSRPAKTRTRVKRPSRTKTFNSGSRYRSRTVAPKRRSTPKSNCGVRRKCDWLIRLHK